VQQVWRDATHIISKSGSMSLACSMSVRSTTLPSRSRATKVLLAQPRVHHDGTSVIHILTSSWPADLHPHPEILAMHPCSRGQGGAAWASKQQQGVRPAGAKGAEMRRVHMACDDGIHYIPSPSRFQAASPAANNHKPITGSTHHQAPPCTTHMLR
jgi:hypothetical protein